jgi:hypothetical protein
MAYTDEVIFEVLLSEEWNDLPEGTHMYVQKELKKEYKGIVVLGPCTLSDVKFPKDKCEKVSYE